MEKVISFTAKPKNSTHLNLAPGDGVRWKGKRFMVTYLIDAL